MAHLSRLLAASAFLCVTSSTAAVVDYRFMVTIDRMFVHDGVTGVNTTVVSSEMPGVRFSVGDQVEGAFTYSTDLPLSGYQPTPPSTGSYNMYSGHGIFARLNFLSTGYTFEGRNDGFGSSVQVANDASTFFNSDVFALHSWAPYSPVTFQSLALNLFDRSGQVFGSADLPAALSLAAFNYANLDYAWLRSSDGSQMHASGRLTALYASATPVEVPVAPTVWLLAVGLPLLAFVRHRS